MTRTAAVFTILITYVFSSLNLSFAEPIYLNCLFVEKDQSPARSQGFSVKVDETSGTITHTWIQNGSAFNAQGFFSANTVTYKRIFPSPVLTMTVTFRIDRTNLHFTEESTWEGSSNDTNLGKCTIQSVSIDRKF